MPVRGHSQDIPVDVLFAIAEGGDAFKERLAQFAEEQEKSRQEAEKSQQASKEAVEQFNAIAKQVETLDSDRAEFEKSCVKARNKIDRDTRRVAESREQAEILATDLDHRKTVADAKDEALNARDDEQTARETALNARESEQAARDTALDRRDRSLTTRETTLSTDLADLNTRLSGFRVDA